MTTATAQQSPSGSSTSLGPASEPRHVSWRVRGQTEFIANTSAMLRWKTKLRFKKVNSLCYIWLLCSMSHPSPCQKEGLQSETLWLENLIIHKRTWIALISAGTVCASVQHRVCQHVQSNVPWTAEMLHCKCVHCGLRVNYGALPWLFWTGWRWRHLKTLVCRCV